LTRVKVRLFHELRSNVGASELELEASTLNEVLQTLIHRSEPVKDLVFDSAGQLRGSLLFYVNNMVQNPPNLSQKLNDGDLVLLVPAAAGG
jgi:molybdopterin synthase sulfur carrier subunit